MRIHLVLSGSAEKVNGIKIFFRIYAAFVNLYIRAESKKVSFEISISACHQCATRWRYKSRTKSTIKELHKKWKSAFLNILDNNERRDEDTLSETDILLAKLNKFHKLFSYITATN